MGNYPIDLRVNDDGDHPLSSHVFCYIPWLQKVQSVIHSHRLPSPPPVVDY